MDHAIKEAAVSTTVTARASLPVRIAIAVIAAISVIVGVLGIVNLASVSNYNQATDSLNANIKASQQQDADFDNCRPNSSRPTRNSVKLARPACCCCQTYAHPSSIMPKFRQN